MPRLLILSSIYYPDPAVASVRVTQWSKWLSEFGWSPHVVCRHTGYEVSREQLSEAVSPQARVSRIGPRVAPPDPRSPGGPPRGGVKGLLRQALEKLLVPDVTIVTWKKLLPEAIEEARRIDPDVVLSSGPPSSTHWLGRRIAQEVGAKWVADFRDPYTIDTRFAPSGLLRPLLLLHRRYERAIYRDADLTVHAIPLHGRWARRAYPNGRDRVRILENGAPRLVTPRAPAPAGPITACTAGFIAEEGPKRLHEAISPLRDQGIEIDFVHAGPIPITVGELPADASPWMRFLGRVPHPEAIRLVAEADILVAYLSEKRSRVLGISSKLYEYIGVGKPILVVNPTRTDRHLLRSIPWSIALTNPTSTEIRDAMRKLSDPVARPPADRWAEIAEKYDRRSQTGQLAAWLDELVK